MLKTGKMEISINHITIGWVHIKQREREEKETERGGVHNKSE